MYFAGEYWAELRRREMLQGLLGTSALQGVTDAESPILDFPTVRDTKALMQGPLVKQYVQECLAKKRRCPKFCVGFRELINGRKSPSALNAHWLRVEDLSQLVRSRSKVAWPNKKKQQSQHGIPGGCHDVSQSHVSDWSFRKAGISSVLA